MGNLATSGPVGHQHKRTYTLDSGGTLTVGFGMIQGVTDTSVTNPSGAAQRCAGVVEFVPFGTSSAISLIRKGECIAIAGGAVNAGDYVTMDGTGKFVTTTSAGAEVAGRACSSAASSGDQFVLDMDPFVY